MSIPTHLIDSKTAETICDIYDDADDLSNGRMH